MTFGGAVCDSQAMVAISIIQSVGHNMHRLIVQAPIGQVVIALIYRYCHAPWGSPPRIVNMSTSETDHLLPKQCTGLRRSSSTSVSRIDHSRSKHHVDAGEDDDGDESHQDHAEDHHQLDEDSAPLQPEAFYELMGMKVPVQSGKTPSNLEAAHGFYSQVCQERRYIQCKYRFYDVMIMFFLILQIFLSAVFIVLGALNVNQHIAIAVLGAVSSVIAGVLALVRGQGLPNRLRMERDGLKKIILDADEMYWDVRGGRQVSYNDVKRLRDAYAGVLEDARRNHPDTWNAATLSVAQVPTRAGRPAKREVASNGCGQAGYD